MKVVHEAGVVDVLEVAYVSEVLDLVLGDVLMDDQELLRGYSFDCVAHFEPFGLSHLLLVLGVVEVCVQYQKGRAEYVDIVRVLVLLSIIFVEEVGELL